MGRVPPRNVDAKARETQHPVSTLDGVFFCPSRPCLLTRQERVYSVGMTDEEPREVDYDTALSAEFIFRLIMDKIIICIAERQGF